MAKARLETEITGDDAPFVKAVDRAEKRAQTFSGKLEHLFRRNQGIRAERAIGGFAENLVSGNVAGAVTSIGSRLGLGLATSVGIAIGVAVTEAITKAEERLQKLQDLKDKTLTPVPSGAFAPAEQFQGNMSQIGETIKAMDEMKRKRDPIGHFEQGAADFLGGVDRNKEDEKTKAELRKQANEDVGQLAVKQDLLNQAQAEETAGSEHQAELLKIQIAHMEKLGKLAAMEAAAGATSAVARNAENRSEQIAVAAAEKRFTMRQQELDSQGKVAQIQASSLTAAEKEVAVARERVNLLNQKIANEPDAQKRQGLQNELVGAQDASDRAEFANRNAPGAALATPERMNEALFQKFKRDKASGHGPGAHTDMSGNPIANPAYSDSPMAYQDGSWGGEGVGTSGAGLLGAGGFSSFFNKRGPTDQQNLVGGIIAGRKNSVDMYQENQGMGDYGTPTNAITGFGKGSFMDSFGNNPPSWMNPAASGSGFRGTLDKAQGAQSQGMEKVAGAIGAAVSAAMKPIFEGMMERYWGR